MVKRDSAKMARRPSFINLRHIYIRIHTFNVAEVHTAHSAQQQPRTPSILIHSHITRLITYSYPSSPLDTTGRPWIPFLPSQAPGFIRPHFSLLPQTITAAQTRDRHSTTAPPAPTSRSSSPSSVQLVGTRSVIYLHPPSTSSRAFNNSQTLAHICT